MRHVVYSSLPIALLLSSACLAQPAPSAFETASVHPNPRAEPQEIQVSSGTLVLRNQPLFFLVQYAWDLTPAQIEAAPWFQQSCFDIVAKAAKPATETEMRVMLQALLIDRFGLKLHNEARPMQVYAIRIAKGGPKFQAAETPGTFVIDHRNPVILNAHHARMADVAQAISGEVGRPVVDETGLKGQYEIHMDVTPYLTQASGGNNGGQLDIMAILFTGFQDLLGLKLESRKENVDVLVIDHAEKVPAEN